MKDETCACGKSLVGDGQTWLNACTDHGKDECVTRDWRTPRMRFFMWLSNLVDACWGPNRKEPKITTVRRVPPSTGSATPTSPTTNSNEEGA